ncbi:hypothetical protein ONZ51_g3327 [Trametes cubensis]|uniref:Glucose receptor Git3 N-terminal domain-containing protein n=1 Tax=Trametes cubensis TaxID=1111947 RepID=A0AAD7TYJ1_9APHY|nr:hypothetical protein ONZ51_g3327 [Trametes cubensis]
MNVISVPQAVSSDSEVALAYGTYGTAQLAGVAFLVIAGAISCAAVVPVLVLVATKWRYNNLRNTRIVPFCVSLLLANLLQAIGTLINGKWVTDRTVHDGPLCRAQGGIKQAGNVAMALWSFALALHVFMLLFSRIALSKALSCALLGAGWALVAFVVLLGPVAIQTPEQGPYFGPTGYWCWITEQYPHEQFFLEYFFEFLSAGLSFFLYTAVLLRVRGNLVRTSGRWHLRFVPHGERWVLAIRRDAVDGCMMHVAARIVWYPLAYAVLLLPVTIARFVTFSGRDVPFRATIFADFVFNLQGVVNVIVLLTTNRLVPDTQALPIYAPRQRVSMSSPEAMGITPFVLPPPKAASVETMGAASAAVAVAMVAKEDAPSFTSRRPVSSSTISSVDSCTPFLHIR